MAAGAVGVGGQAWDPSRPPHPLRSALEACPAGPDSATAPGPGWGGRLSHTLFPTLWVKLLLHSSLNCVGILRVFMNTGNTDLIFPNGNRL